jgi:hypothetical protein
MLLWTATPTIPFDLEKYQPNTSPETVPVLAAFFDAISNFSMVESLAF